MSDGRGAPDGRAAQGGRATARRLHFDPVLGHGPVRTCVGCRRRSGTGDLLRVVAVDGALTPDPRRRLPGRGAWLHPVPECLHRAERRSAFPRALRVPGPLDTRLVRTRIEYAGIVEDSSSGVREPPGPVTEESKVDPS